MEIFVLTIEGQPHQAFTREQDCVARLRELEREDLEDGFSFSYDYSMVPLDEPIDDFD